MEEPLQTGTALAALFLCIAFSRSLRGGFSGPIATTLGAVQIPMAAAILWLLALLIGWWTVAAFVGVSLLVGLLIRRDNLQAWINVQMMTGGGALLCLAAAWAMHLIDK